jgi:hypothetical protein
MCFDAMQLLHRRLLTPQLVCDGLGRAGCCAGRPCCAQQTVCCLLACGPVCHARGVAGVAVVCGLHPAYWLAEGTSMGWGLWLVVPALVGWGKGT